MAVASLAVHLRGPHQLDLGAWQQHPMRAAAWALARRLRAEQRHPARDP